jgi:hypothetical protein
MDMRAAALLLLLNFLFDLGAWSLLLNAVLHSQIRALDGWTVLALCGGWLFATVILIYERQFFVADPSSRWSKALWIRLAVIVLAALITAQPVELMFFRGPIDRRVHEEGVRQEAVSLRQKLAKVQQERENHQKEIAEMRTRLARELEGDEEKRTREKLEGATQARDRSRVELDSAQVHVDALARRLEVQRAVLAAYERAPGHTSAEIEQARERVERARHELGVGRARARELKAELDGEELVVKSAGDEHRSSWEALKQRRDRLVGASQTATRQADADRQRLQSWLAQLVKLAPDARQPFFEAQSSTTTPSADALGMAAWSALPSEPFQYRFPVYDFFEQLRVLSDLRDGRPPLWRGASPGMVDQLKAEYGLDDAQRCVDEGRERRGLHPEGQHTPPCDPIAWERHIAQTHLFFFAWLVIYGIALVLPSLVIAMKLLLPQALKDYYTHHKQVASGYADA